MGQYYLTVNLDKQQYLHPQCFGDGLKLLEFGTSACGTMAALSILLSDGNGRGSGDLHVPVDHPYAGLVGSWTGDRIVVAGDYADDGHFLTEDQLERLKRDSPGECEVLRQDGRIAPTLYEYAKKYFTDISEIIMELMGCDDLLKLALVERTSYRNDSRLPDCVKAWSKELKFDGKKLRRPVSPGPTLILRPDTVLVPSSGSKKKDR
jgi:hypothetical protein